MNSILEAIKFNDQGLVAAIAVDASSGQPLMMAWMNKESVSLSIEQGVAIYYSRSRQSLWRKGESSGNEQKIVDMFLDCDGDTLLIKVEQKGVACHTGRRSCFYRKLQGSEWVEVEPILMDPEKLYNKGRND